MLLGKKLCYSIRWIRNNRKKPDQYGISLNPEYGETPDCTNLHMFLLHQSVLVIVIWIPWLSLSDEKCETKEGSSCWELDPTLCLFFSFYRKWRDELIDSSDPRSGLTGLEPAASALTGRCSDRLNYNPRKIRCTASKFLLFFFFIRTI